MRNLSYNANLNDIAVYKPGQSSINGFENIIKLSSNENPYGTSANAIKAYQECAEKLFKYPDGSASALTQELATYYKLDPSRIVCGAGSDNIIELLCLAFAAKDDEVIFSKHSFPVYRIASKVAGAHTVEIPYDLDYNHDIDGIIKAITPKTRLIFVPTPDNPTGSYISAQKMLKLINALPSNCLLVIDEAYGEYIDAEDYQSGLELAQQYPNIVVTRTFSKLFGLAALRVGWGFVPPIVAEALHKIRSPFNVSLPAQQAAIAALKDGQWTKNNIEKNNEQRLKMTQYYQFTQCKYIPSQANFICLIHNKAKDIDAFLKSKGIIVRHMANNGSPELLRISIGTAAENLKLQSALTTYFTEVKP